jgi:glycosyltransferase involved in cell wall biosynthesis
MRIAMLHWAFPPVVGGVETHLEELGAALVRRGHTVMALVGDESARTGARTHRGIAVQGDPLMQPRSDPDPRRLYDLVSRFVDRQRPDVLHAHNMHYFSPRHAEALLRLKSVYGLPLVLTAHNAWHDRLGQEMLRYRELWDRVIAVSRYLAATLAAQGYAAERIDVVHHGVDPARWITAPPPEGQPPTIFHPARLSLDKGSLTLVRALHRIRRELPAARLMLAGTGTIVDFASRQAKEVAMVRREIRRLGLEGAVTLEAIPWQEMPRAFSQAHVVTYPSRFDEPFGIAALEGMASARPVVVTEVGGMPEFVRDGVDGFVVTPGDEQEIADRLSYLLAHPVLARRMGAAARERAQRRFHLREMLERTLAVYEQAITPRRLPAQV